MVSMSLADNILTVSELNYRVKSTLEAQHGMVKVQGEVSNLSTPKSGHIYFTLKDSGAEIACAMFKRYVSLNQEMHLLKEGNACCVEGLITLYPQRGQYQLMVHRVSPHGEGILRKKYLMLHKKLKQQGIFDVIHKKPLPAFPTSVAVVTSPAAAGLQDLLVTLKKRFPFCALTIYPAQVQGDNAAKELSNGVLAADKANHDALILCRGGGSIEDLWCFNDETLAMTIFHANTPIISAVGHETDWTICDEVSDVRAATPTQAALILTPDMQQLHDKLVYTKDSMHQKIYDYLNKKHWHYRLLVQRLRHPLSIINEQQQQILLRTKQLQHAIWRCLDSYQQPLDFYSEKISKPTIIHHIDKKQQQLTNDVSSLNRLYAAYVQTRMYQYLRLRDSLNQLNPKALMQRGFAVISCAEKRLVSAKQASSGSKIKITLHDGSFEATVAAK